MVKSKISNMSLCMVAYFLMNSLFLGAGLFDMFALSKEATVICAIIGSVLGIIPVTIYMYIFKNSGGRNIFELNIYLFGKIFGGIINFILSMLALFISVIVLYNLTMFLNLNYLVLTDKFYIAFLLILPVIYAISKGIGTIARTAQILVYVSVACFFVAVVGLINTIDIDNLLPVFTSDIQMYVYSIFIYLSFNTVPLFLLLCVSKNDVLEDDKFSKNIFKTYIISNLSSVLVFFITLAGLGYPIISVLKYPEFLILKQISIGDIVERVENILSIYFVIPMIITVIMGIYYAFVNFNMYCKNSKYKKGLVYVLPILTLFISMNIFENMTISTEFNMKYLAVILVCVGLSLHTLILGFLSRKNI